MFWKKLYCNRFLSWESVQTYPMEGKAWILLRGKTFKPRLPVRAEKDSPCSGNEAARNEISILIAGMPRSLRGKHHFFFADLIQHQAFANIIITKHSCGN
jgi:hypothetical protein